MLLLDRRKFQEPSFRPEDDRRRAIPGHEIQLGHSPERPNWTVAHCSCGKVAESSAEGIVEAWVACHRWEAKGQH